MKVKIRNEIFDPNEEPFMLIFESDEEKIEFYEQIRDMLPGTTKYCQYPDSMNQEEAKNFMRIEE